MQLTKDYYLTTSKDGELDDTTTDEIDHMFGTLANDNKIVLHFHGGLVSKTAGLGIAARLLDLYVNAGAHPVFFVYESQVWEVIPRNLGEIAGEDIFKTLLQWLIKHVVGKFRAAAGTKAVGAAKPADMEVFRQLARSMQADGQPSREPYADEAIPASVEPVSPEQLQELRTDLTNDTHFQSTVQAIAQATMPEKLENTNSRGLVTREQKSIQTLMSPDVVDELHADAQEANAKGTRGLFSSAALVVRAGKVLVRIVDRFRHHRDHGIYCTIVEEILREFYIANVGGIVWKTIKKETWDTFQPGTKPRGGVYFLDKLEALLQSKPKDQWPRISVVGHSTGAVFINNLLEAVTQRQNAGRLKDFTFDNVIFLAPACTMWAFNKTVTQYRGLYGNFRLFGMHDAVESQDHMLPPIYTRSLLYFVSGLLECDANNQLSVDVPLVGMERYFTAAQVYNQADEDSVRDYVLKLKDGCVWSVTANGGPGLRSSSLHHGDFDDDPDTLASVQDMLRAN